MRSRLALPALVAVLTLTAPAAARADVPVAKAAAACPGANVQPTAKTIGAAKRATRCLVNLERKARGLKPLRANRKLARAAKRHSKAMKAKRFFAHVSPSGRTLMTRVRAAGYLRGARSFRVGENIAWGQGDLATPLSIHRAWMRSPGHRANILRRGFREIGVGIVSGSPVGGGGATYTQNFGSRA